MMWSWTLFRYLGRQFIVGVGTVYAGFLFLALSIDIVGLADHTAAKHVPTGVVIAMALLQLPDLGLKLMSFAVLLGGVFAFVRLSRSQELIAIRAAGVSAWDLLAPSLAVAVALGVFTVMALTPLTSRMLVQYSEMEAKYIRGQASQLAISRNGFWTSRKIVPTTKFTTWERGSTAGFSRHSCRRFRSKRPPIRSSHAPMREALSSKS